MMNMTEGLYYNYMFFIKIVKKWKIYSPAGREILDFLFYPRMNMSKGLYYNYMFLIKIVKLWKIYSPAGLAINECKYFAQE